MDASRLGTYPRATPAPLRLGSYSEFIQRTAQQFQGRQDRAHNAIIQYLLETSFAAEQLVGLGIPERQWPAYDVVRGDLGNTMKPLYWVRTAQQLLQVRSADFFIRDYMQLQTRGGKQASEPLEFAGRKIVDGAARSLFAERFNAMVADLNQQPAVLATGQVVRDFAAVAHRDAIQLIPYPAEAAYRVSQFAGDIMQHVTLRDNHIFSSLRLQGIFGSDGAFRNMQLLNNRVTTAGAHTITLNGLLSGCIEGNRDEQYRPLSADKIVLNPLRIGGGADIFVLGFNNGKLPPEHVDFYDYTPISGQALTDLRREPVLTPSATNWTDVDMVKLRQLFPATWQQVNQLQNNSASTAVIQEAWQRMMRQVGRQMTV